MIFETVQRLARERDEARLERDEALALAATCSCGTSPMTYEGPEPDCAVHGAVRAFNLVTEELAQAHADMANAQSAHTKTIVDLAVREMQACERAANAEEAARTLEGARDEARAEVKRLTGQRILSVVFGHHKGAPKPFALYRDRDETGVSGTGVVALGTEFEDGMVVLRWTSAFPTSVVFHERGIESVEAIHGHGGKTRVVWLSDELGPLAEMETERDAMRPVVEATKAWVRAVSTQPWTDATEAEIHAAEHAMCAAVDQMGARTDEAGPAETGVMSAATLELIAKATGGTQAVELVAEFDDDAPSASYAPPQSDEKGPGVAQDVEKALGAQTGAQGAVDRRPVVWRHPCGWEQVSPIPARCPSCGGGEAWGGRRG